MRVELIHTYSLIHDDLPAMDNDDFRRGVPTNHKVFGEAMAILAGDALLTLAFRPRRRQRRRGTDAARGSHDVLVEIADAAGQRGHGRRPGRRSSSPRASRSTPTTVDYIHTHKTAALIRASLRVGAILAGADAAQLRGAAAWRATDLGLAFQIVDDILDVDGEPRKSSARRRARTRSSRRRPIPPLHGLDASRRRAPRSRSRDAHAALGRARPRAPSRSAPSAASS